MQTPPSLMSPARLVLIGAVLTYLVLALWTVRSVGTVGEVAIGWSQPEAPTVWVELDPRLEAGEEGAGHSFGPLHARQTRPVEQLVLGPIRLPWAINGHTGGHADWLSLLVFSLTTRTGAVQAQHVSLGALFIVLLHRFLRFNATPTAAGSAAIVLATSWSFLFYRKVLGGTELLLQASILLCLWAIWSRRWRGGRHGLTALGIGIGLGLGAKLSFGLSLLALLLTTAIMRWDKPALRPPLPGALWRPLLAIFLLSVPVWSSLLHHSLGPPEAARLVSHDFAQVQWSRVLGGLTGADSAARESGLANLGFWASDPLGFFRKAYGASGGGPTPWHLIGWAVVALGALLGWRDLHPTPRTALLRFSTVFLLLQTTLLAWVARDMHHLAQATPTLAIVCGLAIEQLAALTSPRNSLARFRVAVLLCLPLCVAGIQDLRRTDAVMETIEVPTWTATGQQDLRSLITDAQVQRLVVSDYESYGLLELLVPGVTVEHAWGAASKLSGDPLGLQILELAEGGHLLVVRASAPMRYNWPRNALANPEQDRKKLEKLATQAGLELEEVGRLTGDRAVLYQLSRSSSESARGQFPAQ